jgi:hypothetical protein
MTIKVGDVFFLRDDEHYGFGLVIPGKTFAEAMQIKWQLINNDDGMIKESFSFSFWNDGQYTNYSGNILVTRHQDRVLLHLGKINEKKKLEIKIKYCV